MSKRPSKFVESCSSSSTDSQNGENSSSSSPTSSKSPTLNKHATQTQTHLHTQSTKTPKSNSSKSPVKVLNKRFNVVQKVGKDTRAGPSFIKRKINDPLQVVVQRRHGEGSKPLFDRNEINVNPEAEPPHANAEAINQSSVKSKKPTLSATHSRNGTTEMRSRDPKFRHTVDRSSQSGRSPKRETSYRSRSDDKKCSYYVDNIREDDRLRRRYRRRDGSRDRDHTPHRRRSYSRERYCDRKNSYNSSRSRERRSRRRSASRSPVSRHRDDSRIMTFPQYVPPIPMYPAPYGYPPPILPYDPMWMTATQHHRPPFMPRPFGPSMPMPFMPLRMPMRQRPIGFMQRQNLPMATSRHYRPRQQPK